MKLRLTSRIVLFFTLLAVVLLVTVGILSYRSGSEGLKAAAISEMLAIAIEKESALDTWIEARLDDGAQMSRQVDFVKNAASLVAAAPASKEARLAHAVLLRELEPHLQSPRSDFTELFVMEPENGKVVASTSPAEEGKSKLGRPFFDNSKTDLFLQAPYDSADLGVPAMTVGIPLRADGRTVAVLALRLDLAAMTRIVQRRTGLHQTEDSYLINAERLLVTQPRLMTEPAVLRLKIDTEAGRRVAALSSGVMLTPDYRGVPVITVYRWIPRHRLGLLVEIDQAEALAPARAFARSVVLISSLALLATAGLAFLLARTITRPLRMLRDRVRHFAEKRIDEPSPEFSGDEVRVLEREFDQMAARIGERTAELAESNEALHTENAERRRAEQTLQRQQTELRLLFDLVPAMIFFKDTKNNILRVNKRAAENAGKSIQEIEGRPALDTYPQEAAGFYADDLEVIHSGAPRRGIVETVLDGAGRKLWIQTDKVPVTDVDGKVTGIVVMAQDITERKETEEARDRMVAILDCTSDLVSIADPAGHILYLNCAGRTLLGVGDDEDITRTTVADFLPNPASHPILTEGIPTAVRQGTWTGESVLLSRRGQEIPVSQVILAHKSPDGEVEFLSTIVRDTTARTRAEQELRRSEDRMRLQTAALEAAANGVAITDRTGAIQWVNRAFAQLTGYSAEESMGRNPRFLKSGEHPESFYQELWQTISRGHVWKGEIINRRKDGQLYDEEMTITPVRDSAGTVSHFVAVKQDITERKQAEASMESMHKKLVDVSRDAGMAVVATSVLHNVGNVLNSVNVSADLILEKVNRLRPPSLARVVALLRDHAQDMPDFLARDPQGKEVPGYLSALVEQLADPQKDILPEVVALRKNVEHIREIVRMQQSYARVSGVLETIALTDLVEDAIRINAAGFTRHEVQVIREYSPVPSFPIEKHKVLQILVNLLSNAKYALDAGGGPDSKLTIRVAMNGSGTVKVSVMDNGVGIAPENLTRIFQHGFTTRKTGHGFGLHSGALAAQELGGSLTASSGGSGQGAIFTLELPCGTTEGNS